MPNNRLLVIIYWSKNQYLIGLYFLFFDLDSILEKWFLFTKISLMHFTLMASTLLLVILLSLTFFLISYRFSVFIFVCDKLLAFSYPDIILLIIYLAFALSVPTTLLSLIVVRSSMLCFYWFYKIVFTWVCNYSW